ncbi:hypothetical protein [Streptomyces spectabilis]|uniref:Uncharacterized protein n=1 Tax=Streptomyces spectabilis TaxID=68270 RepID=A0A7W8EZH4_STRST|nr:hypothetical protein [Streptomyces spectabilis]MBB5109184.1 hypothetical protein [Streptomyces spectabilis]MCI3907741.1 hypothetical protein [Streptomyces spectabilis]GGV51258.1 hypothetical protein GCM10010245_80750 [Streptomyces spectabilis]
MTPEEEAAFQGISQGINQGMAFGNVDPYEDVNAYGTPVAKPQKAGLTRRGKVAIAVAGVAIAGGGTVWWNVHSAGVEADRKEAAALQVQMKKLELQELRIRNEARAKDEKSDQVDAAARQARVNQCVKDSSDVVGKGYGSPSRSEVIADCKQQYDADADGSGMAAAGSSKDTGGGINSATLLGLVAGGGLVVAVAANRGRKAASS